MKIRVVGKRYKFKPTQPEAKWLEKRGYSWSVPTSVLKIQDTFRPTNLGEIKNVP